nr:type 2 lanthipeptide synthetase LanM [uncultured Rhodoferax sp.]
MPPTSPSAMPTPMPNPDHPDAAPGTADTAPLIADIARRNSGLQATAIPADQRQTEPAVRQRWQRWLRFGGGYNWRTLRRRMRAEGLRPSAVYQPRELAVLPAWCATLERLMRQAKAWGHAPQKLAEALPPDATHLPFATLLAPCLLVARERLAARGLQLHPEQLAPDALHGMERALLTRLAEVAGGCLLALFAPRSKVNAVMLSLLGGGNAQAPTGQYQAFVQDQLNDGYTELFQRWPVLARLMASIVDDWADSCHEFLSRLDTDHARLRQRFFPGLPSAAVTAVDATLSDPHAGGRTVVKLSFADGTRLVYKPRPMAMEALFSQAVAWLNAQGAELGAQGPGHRVAQVWAQQDYGWMEWIETQPMSSEDAHAYHWRMGSLLGLFRALNGADMHLENIVAAGTQPVFIDVECLLHPSSRPLLEMPAVARDEGWLTPRAVLHMGVMPFYGFSKNNLPHDMGAIGGPPSGGGPEVPQFVHANSDWMALQWVVQPLTTHHYPRTAQGWCNSLLHGQAIAAGFRDTMGRVLAQRDWLLDSADSPLAGLRTACGRHLARTTWNYGTLLRGAVAPESLTDGVMFDLTFEPLHRHMALFSDGFRAMAPAEREDLRQLDVPRFGFAANSLMLLDARGRALGQMHDTSPYAATAASLRTLTPQQIDWEANVLERALWPEDGSAAIGVQACAEKLLARRLCAPNGQTLWLGLGDAGEGLTVRPIELGLYAGVSGVALALAAAGHASADKSLSQLANQTLMSALDQLPATARGDAAVDTSSLEKAFYAGLPGIGLDQGAAGILFALDQCASLSGEAALHRRVEHLARHWVSGPRLEALLRPGHHFDYLNGVAGLLLVLLNLGGTLTARKQFLADAQLCGDHLLQHARPTEQGLVWAKPGTHGLSGLSHGGAGFAVALVALYRATGHRPYRDAAFAALAHEATLFNPAVGNWRDMRGFTGHDVSTVQHCGCSWCHGAPGIALGRAAVIRMLADELTSTEYRQLRSDLEVALATTRQSLADLEAPAIDDLCCGAVGRMDILLECGRLLGQAEWVDFARQQAHARLVRWTAEPNGTSLHYWFSGKNMAGADLSLFKGIASLTYLQARLAAPDSVPCVLLPYHIPGGVLPL